MSKCPLSECGRTIPCRPPAPTCPHRFEGEARCTCPRIDGYRIRSKSCAVHAECLATVGPVPKLDGETFVCVKPAGHDMPHEAPDGMWWEESGHAQ